MLLRSVGPGDKTTREDDGGGDESKRWSALALSLSTFAADIIDGSREDDDGGNESKQ